MKFQLGNTTICLTERENLGDLNTHYRYQAYENQILIDIRIVNTGKEPVSPGEFRLFDAIDVTGTGDIDQVYVDCKDLLGFCGPQPLSKEWKSYSTCGLISSEASSSLLMGFTDVRSYFYHFLVSRIGRTVHISAICPFEQTVIAPGASVHLSELVVLSGPSLQQSFAAMATRMAGHMGRVSSPKKVPTGYCSWYYHYGTEKSEDIFHTCDALAKTPLKDSIDYILIDGGWNDAVGDTKFNWGDWYAKSKFPEGMKAVADTIHAKGFKAGLWLAPFSVTTNSELFKNHPDWILGLGQDLLNNGGEVYGLDLTHPDVQVFLEKTIREVFYDWGYDFIKIDFLLYGALEAARHDKNATSAMAFRKGMEILRDCTGADKMILNCGSPLLQSVGCCDSMRIGPDVGSQWHFPLNEQMWQYGNCSIKPAMRYTIYHHWMNNILWFNDPDCLVARSRSNGIEFQEFRKWFGEAIRDESVFGLTWDEMSAWTKLVWITGGVRFLSDDFPSLDEERKVLLTRMFHEPVRQAVLLDHFDNADTAIFRTVEGPDRLGIFNLSDDPVVIRLQSEPLGLTAWHYREITDGTEFSGKGEVLEFPVLPPHGGAIYEAMHNSI
jgi:alpha-galactosidase